MPRIHGVLVFVVFSCNIACKYDKHYVLKLFFIVVAILKSAKKSNAAENA